MPGGNGKSVHEPRRRPPQHAAAGAVQRRRPRLPSRPRQRPPPRLLSRARCAAGKRLTCRRLLRHPPSSLPNRRPHQPSPPRMSRTCPWSWHRRQHRRRRHPPYLRRPPRQRRPARPRHDARSLWHPSRRPRHLPRLARPRPQQRPRRSAQRMIGHGRVQSCLVPRVRARSRAGHRTRHRAPWRRPRRALGLPHRVAMTNAQVAVRPVRRAAWAAAEAGAAGLVAG